MSQVAEIALNGGGYYTYFENGSCATGCITISEYVAPASNAREAAEETARVARNAGYPGASVNTEGGTSTLLYGTDISGNSCNNQTIVRDPALTPTPPTPTPPTPPAPPPPAPAPTPTPPPPPPPPAPAPVPAPPAAPPVAPPASPPPPPVNIPPSALNLQMSQTNYCGSPYPPVFLSWTYSDPERTSQSAYQIQVSPTPGFGSLAVDSGRVPSSSGSYAPAGLGYAAGYYWRVKIWDAGGAESVWTAGPYFTTKAQHPTADFVWSPARPALNTQASFVDRSSAYGGSAISGWAWTFEQGNPASSTLRNPSVRFAQQGQGKKNAITLSVSDTNGNSCSATKSVSLGSSFPQWQEISPLSWIQEIFQLP